MERGLGHEPRLLSVNVNVKLVPLRSEGGDERECACLYAPCAAAPDSMLTTNPFDDDKLREECGVFGIWGADSASAIVALGLHALQHRGQEAAGMTSFDGTHLPQPPGDGPCRRQFRQGRGDPPRSPAAPRSAMSAIRPPARPRCATSSRCSPSSPSGGFAVAHNGNISNAMRLRGELNRRGSIFQSTCDTEVIIHLVATSSYRTLLDRFIDALKQVEGAY